MHNKTEWGGCYSGLSKKRSFLRQLSHKIYHKFAYFPTSKHSFLLLLPIASTLGILALVSTFFISADIASNSYALDGTNLNSEITAEINGTHYITLSAPDVAFSITPDTNDSGTTIGLDTTKVDVSVKTNAIGGAELYLSTSSNTNALYKDGNVNNSNLPSIDASLSTTSNPTTLDNLATNTWGYSLDNTNYSGVPTIESPNHIASIDGVNTGTTSSSVISATIPIYYAAKVDTSIPSGSYANSVTYLAVVDGGIVTSAELTSITVDGDTVEQLQLDKTNTILITTNLKTNTYGTPRVYYTTTSPSGYAECGNVVVASNAEGYMTIQCETTPTTVATGLTLHIVPKGTPSSTNPSDMTGDPFCSDGTYQANTSECEAGEWKWGNLTIALPDIATPGPDIDRPATGWDDLEIMQHMTPEICASASEGDTKQLIDWRDDKTYWVAKLADGNCWMTQNLELDLSTSTPLTSELSDVTSSWTPTNSTYTSAQDGSASNTTVAQSWNLGKYVWKTPNSTSTCSPDINFSEYSCASYWQDASNMTPMATYRTDGVSVEGNTYDAHYLAGNYYSWEAATAGTGHSYTHGGSQASDSICPKGFELPTSSSSFNSTPGSFYNLFNQYGFASSTGSGANSITRAPLFFVRSGEVYPTSFMANVGVGGFYWSSVARSSSYAYYSRFYSNSVDPSGNYAAYSGSRYYGYSVRCVALSNQ